jgi:hypothetical protein
MSRKYIYGPDEKRLLQITLAKNISPEAQSELLATALDGRNIHDVYLVCPKCDIPSGVEVIYKDPVDEAAMEAVWNGEIKLINDFDKNRNIEHNIECLNCNHTWVCHIERIPNIDDGICD